ncbi:MAG: cobalamin-independent methionine synthase II family protein [Planctomycetes bacterium]|nr:cobalamin-independent methionine synthase II family protein [Planctomycetota bacterium]
MSDMEPVPNHALAADATVDGGDLDCGGGLLLLIRRSIDPLPRGGLLDVRSTETSVDVELPAWCRMTGNELVSWTKHGSQRSFLVCKGRLAERARPTNPAGVAPAPARAHADGAPTLGARGAPAARTATVASTALNRARVLPAAAPAASIAPLSVMGIGSWPRPKWLVRVLHEFLEGRLSESEFHASADDAVRLAIAAQERSGAHVVSDGEQRRDSYVSFVGSRLENCQLVPLTDLLPMVDQPEKLAAEFARLDVPAEHVRHPAILGRIARTRPIARHELDFARGVTQRPIKVALPGPYLLSRVLFLECMAEKTYATREELAVDVVNVLREELFDLLAAGASIVQFDEPVLTEVVFGGEKHGTSFMCGALSARGDADRELAFARELLDAVTSGAPRERVAVHVCRGNWTPDESAALRGDYRPLLDYFARVDVGTCLLELCTPRAGELEVLRALPDDKRVGVGAVNQKAPLVEDVASIVAHVRRAIDVLGKERVLLVPDCGFATFADNPVASAAIAESKLAALVQAAARIAG